MGDEVAKRYFLMRHDETAVDNETGNKRYLYPHSQTVIATVGEGKAAVDIMQTRVEYYNDGGYAGARAKEAAIVEAEYLANYQFNRLRSGLEARGERIYRTLNEAQDAAEQVSELLTPHK